MGWIDLLSNNSRTDQAGYTANYGGGEGSLFRPISNVEYFSPADSLPSTPPGTEPREGGLARTHRKFAHKRLASEKSEWGTYQEPCTKGFWFVGSESCRDRYSKPGTVKRAERDERGSTASIRLCCLRD